jgi:hypothetical protein
MVYSETSRGPRRGEGGQERGGMWSQALMEYPMCTHTAESARIRKKEKP